MRNKQYFKKLFFLKGNRSLDLVRSHLSGVTPRHRTQDDKLLLQNPYSNIYVHI